MSEPAKSPEPKSKRWARLGIVLILVSGVLWFSIFAVPFLSISTGAKAATAGALFAGVQVFWWTGAALAGPETVRRIKGWFSRKQSADLDRS